MRFKPAMNSAINLHEEQNEEDEENGWELGSFDYNGDFGEMFWN